MKTFSHLLRFRRSDQTIQVSLAGLQRMEETISRLEAVDLSLEEWTRAQRYRNENARALWILGRLAAKRALFQLEPTAVLSSLSVQSAVTGTPYFQGLESSYEVSITHSKSVALALVSPMRHPVTIDLESIRTERVAAITKMLTDRESQLASETEDPISTLTLLWTAKEALSKWMRSGMSFDFRVLEVKSWKQKGNHISGAFSHVYHLKFESWRVGDWWITMVFPNKSECLEWDLDSLRSLLEA